MNCTNCNQKIKVDSLFCPKCGFNIVAKSKAKKIPPFWIIVILAILGIILKIFVSDETNGKSDYSTSELIKQTVTQIKDESKLPQQIDDVTKLVDITPEYNAIHYHYILDGIDQTKISNDNIKTSILSGACKNDDVRRTLNEGINMQYSYNVAGSYQTYFVEITEQDCK